MTSLEKELEARTAELETLLDYANEGDAALSAAPAASPNANPAYLSALEALLNCVLRQPAEGQLEKWIEHIYDYANVAEAAKLNAPAASLAVDPYLAALEALYRIDKEISLYNEDSEQSRDFWKALGEMGGANLTWHHALADVEAAKGGER